MIPRPPFLRNGMMQYFVHFSIVLCLYSVLHNRMSMSPNFLVFHRSGDTSLRPVLLIKPWIYFSYSFWYVLASSLKAFVSFCALAFVGFLLLIKDTFFELYRVFHAYN